MAISVFDLFKIGIGPSSSHTVGPMLAASKFAESLETSDLLRHVTNISVELYGSLGATGRGHGTDKAILLGLEGEKPSEIDPTIIPDRLAKIRGNLRLNLLGRHSIAFDDKSALIFHRRQKMAQHPNAMRFVALDSNGQKLSEKLYFSLGGGFVADESNLGVKLDETPLPFDFTSGAELLRLVKENSFKISDLMMKNETVWRTETEIKTGLLNIWGIMQECVTAGCRNEGTLPGGLSVRRRAPALFANLRHRENADDQLAALDWVNLYALAVNEENAAGGRVVTAPTNGAAGIIPAVLHYYWRFIPGADEDGVVRFLLTAGAVGMLFKRNASISGAEVGCQGEVGAACSMAAAGLAEVLGGTPEQVENAAEIGMEHNLGLTCDPVGGQVQIPCIERNAMGSVKAINAARLALCGDGKHFVSLDRVIKTMRDTGADMNAKYKETARGGLALNVFEVPVNIVEC